MIAAASIWNAYFLVAGQLELVLEQGKPRLGLQLLNHHRLDGRVLCQDGLEEAAAGERGGDN